MHPRLGHASGDGGGGSPQERDDEEGTATKACEDDLDDLKVDEVDDCARNDGEDDNILKSISVLMLFIASSDMLSRCRGPRTALATARRRDLQLHVDTSRPFSGHHRVELSLSRFLGHHWWHRWKPHFVRSEGSTKTLTPSCLSATRVLPLRGRGSDVETRDGVQAFHVAAH